MIIIRNLKRVAVGVSGGVDSAVAAWLLKRKGYDVHGVFMRNWDASSEEGGANCTVDNELQLAAWVCRTIDIPFTEVNFVAEYWNDVFQYMLSEYSKGRTPNPDVLCNRHIKFGHLKETCEKRLGTEFLATGHYARLLHDGVGGVKLFKAIDQTKDQSYFLSRVHQSALRKTIFPLGRLHKKRVRKLAEEAGLTRVAHKKDSTGICFIGKRNFPAFISQYMYDKPGRFIDLETGEDLGPHAGQHQWTLGQCCHLNTFAKSFVSRKLTDSADMIVCTGMHHPSLYRCSLVASDLHWTAGHPPHRLTRDGRMQCDFRFVHLGKVTRCLVTVITPENLDKLIMYPWRMISRTFNQDRLLGCQNLLIELETPLRSIATGQFAVLYCGSECIGSGNIAVLGPSLYDLNVNNCKHHLQAMRSIWFPSLLTYRLARHKHHLPDGLELARKYYHLLVNTPPYSETFKSLIKLWPAEEISSACVEVLRSAPAAGVLEDCLTLGVN